MDSISLWPLIFLFCCDDVGTPGSTHEYVILIIDPPFIASKYATKNFFSALQTKKQQCLNDLKWKLETICVTAIFIPFGSFPWHGNVWKQSFH